MADGRDPTTASNARTPYSWTEIFRCFQIALDPRKLLVAALGILVMSFMWWLLSAIFCYKAPDPQRARSTSQRKSRKTSKRKNNPRPASPTRRTSSRPPSRPRSPSVKRETRLSGKCWTRSRGQAAGCRTMPWYESRGKNPFLFVTDLIGSPPVTWWSQSVDYLKAVAPVLLEPLVKLLLPVAKIDLAGRQPARPASICS